MSVNARPENPADPLNDEDFEIISGERFRDDEGYCLTCDSLRCCQHDPCVNCFDCLGLNQGDFL